VKPSPPTTISLASTRSAFACEHRQTVEPGCYLRTSQDTLIQSSLRRLALCIKFCPPLSLRRLSLPYLAARYCSPFTFGISHPAATGCFGWQSFIIASFCDRIALLHLRAIASLPHVRHCRQYPFFTPLYASRNASPRAILVSPCRAHAYSL
jgi:hypothetical protein